MVFYIGENINVGKQKMTNNELIWICQGLVGGIMLTGLNILLIKFAK